jgi:antitoxin MazE
MDLHRNYAEYIMTVKANIVQIGNSKGIRLSKAVLEQSGLRDAVEIEVRDRCLLIRPAAASRAGWDEAFAEMAQRGERNRRRRPFHIAGHVRLMRADGAADGQCASLNR